MTLEEIRELIQVVTESGIAELEVQRGEDRVRIRRVVAGRIQEFVAPAPLPAVDAQPARQAVAASSGGPPTPPPHTTAAVDPLNDPSLVTVKSPIVGTFYESPSPGAAAFVKVGDTVRPGDVLCIIESMKLMNEIEAEQAGVIAARFATNAQPVEYGEALFAIRPA